MRKLVSCFIALMLVAGMLAACAPCNTDGTVAAVQTAPPDASTQDTTATEPTDSTEETTEPMDTGDPTEQEQETTEGTEPTQTETTKPTEPPHTHSYTSTKVAATCTSKGYTLHKCSCGSSYTSDETAALGHSWGNWTVVTQPTTQQEGKQTRTCSRCGATESQSIPKVEAPALEWSDLDLNRAMAVGNQYATSKYGCVLDTSLNVDTPYVGYNFPTPLSRREIVSSANDPHNVDYGKSYQQIIEDEMKGNVDLFIDFSIRMNSDYTKAHINCWCVIQDNQLWFYVFYQ